MKELPKIYEPQQVEGRIYQMWMDHDCFKAEPDPDKKPFSIVMPPPPLPPLSSARMCPGPLPRNPPLPLLPPRWKRRAATTATTMSCWPS